MNICMDKKKIIEIVLKVLLYALTLIGSALGISALTSCAFQRSSVVDGRATIITTDTTFVQHSGFLKTK